jgi:sec-independent protein translocase protein TatA
MTLPAQFLAGLPGGYEWLIVLVIFLLLFGRRLPGVARSLGQGISSFKKGLNDPDMDDEDEKPTPKKNEKTEKETV